MRIVFMGTPDFSVPVLEALLGAGHEILAVYSQPPRASGRGMQETKSPVHRSAEAYGIPVRTPLNFKLEADRAAFAALNSDAAVVVAYGLLLPRAILDAPKYGCFNIHASRLPRWRGAAPIQRAIMAGDTSTAVMVMRMEEGLDTGPICLTREVAIPLDMTVGELHDRLAAEGARAIVTALEMLAQDTLTVTPQPVDGVTYARKIDKAEARIDFSKSSSEVANHIRGLSPFPGAWFNVQGSSGEERVKVLRATAVDGSGPPGTVLDDSLTIACASGAVRLTEVQRSGKRPAPAAEFLRGFPVKPGTRLL